MMFPKLVDENLGSNMTTKNSAATRTRLHVQAILAATVLLTACGHPSVCPNIPTAKGLIGQASYIAGQPNTGGISSQTLNGPLGSVASNGTLFYVADTSNNRILGYTKIPTDTPNGISEAAEFVIGQSNFTQNAPAASATGLASPVKVSISSPDNTKFIVADSSNNRVLIWNSLPTDNTQANVVIGQSDFTSHAINQGLNAPTAATLNNPTAAIIANGMLIVADKGNNRVLIWNSVPTTNNVQANIVLGQSSMITGASGIESSSANPKVLALNGPSDIWTDGFTSLFVSDSGNNRILFWNGVPGINNTFPNFVIGQTGFGQGDPQTSAGRLRAPWGLASDGSHLFVGDSGNNRVLVYTGIQILQNGILASNVFGQADFSHSASNDADQSGKNSVDPTQKTLFSPAGVFVTMTGSLFVSDRSNNRIVEYATVDGVDGSETNLCK